MDISPARADEAAEIAAHVASRVTDHFRDLGVNDAEIEHWCSICATEEVWQTRLEDPRALVLVVRSDGKIKATAAVQIEGSVAHLGSMYVHPDLQRQGLATRLVQACVRWSAEQGADLARMETAEPNAPFRSIADRCGFELIDTYDDAIITSVRFCIYECPVTGD